MRTKEGGKPSVQYEKPDMVCLRARSRRKAQALVESAAGTALIVFVFVLLIMFSINVYFALRYSADLKLIANEAAKVALTNKYWLGMQRPDYDANTAAMKAQNIANTLAKRLGMPPVQIEMQEDETEDGDIIEITAKVAGLPLPYTNAVFPTGISLSAVGLAVQPQGSVYAAIDINAHASANAKDKDVFDTVRLPVYGFFREKGVVLGPDGQPSRDRFGNTTPDSFDFPTAKDGFPWGKMGPIRGPKYFRGLPLPLSAWDPRLAMQGANQGIFDQSSASSTNSQPDK